jgi:hypothetical protein
MPPNTSIMEALYHFTPSIFIAANIHSPFIFNDTLMNSNQVEIFYHCFILLHDLLSSFIIDVADFEFLQPTRQNLSDCHVNSPFL